VNRPTTASVRGTSSSVCQNRLALRELGRELQAGQFAVDLRADFGRHLEAMSETCREGIDQVRHARRVRGAPLRLSAADPLRHAARAHRPAIRHPGQREQLVERGDQAPLIARIDIEQIGAADDLIQARGALQRADLLEHALIVAGPPCRDHQLFAASGQAIHLHGGIHDGEQQRRSHDREADQHQSAQ
jgi:hypothetical protein